MKIRLRCRIFGHDFRTIDDSQKGYRASAPSPFCRHCGLSKEELQSR
ncbi:unnamed protein product [marine sediment metagenome]|uniref:Uncharacterized protein n=1 Tax=marine sediment metagenome TaxID=412755 RepID=X0ZUJ7_9ZZZZ